MGRKSGRDAAKRREVVRREAMAGEWREVKIQVQPVGDFVEAVDINARRPIAT